MNRFLTSLLLIILGLSVTTPGIAQVSIEIDTGDQARKNTTVKVILRSKDALAASVAPAKASLRSQREDIVTAAKRAKLAV